MIHRIYSDLPSFKELNFHKALNIVLADKSPGATEQQTRNAAGKTSIIEIIHFLTGSQCDQQSIFSKKAIAQYSFGMEFDLLNSRVCVERSAAAKGDIVVIRGDTSKWPVTTQTDKTTGKEIISWTDWKKVLGHLIFGLEYHRLESAATKYTPKFRSLFSYFVRREGEDGMRSPLSQSKDQQPWDQQVAIMFLLGLDWPLAKQWQLVRDKEKLLAGLKQLAKTEETAEILESAARLRTLMTVSEDRMRRLREALQQFNVLPGYRDLEREASEIANGIAQLFNDNFLDTELTSDIEKSLREETAPSFDQIEGVYKEIGISLAGNVKRRFEEIQSFHLSVIENRRAYLSRELNEAKERIFERNAKLGRMSEREAQIMGLLKTHGALDQYTKLHTELSKREAETESIRQRYLAAEEFESKKNELGIQRGRLQVRLKQEYEERRGVVDHAILTFEGFSSDLYEKAGSLTIDTSANGPKFEISIQGQGSKGIGNMQTFCFDMMLMTMCGERNLGPGFLVHDSHLFDGVDERQTAKALQIGETKANELGFQYIVTMNSDIARSCLGEKFIDEHAILPRLTDATEDGGLFGIRF